jgi:carbon-monoxide dehydrogenase large subunit
MDWALARADDVPPLRIEHLETLSPLNPLGLKGVGESGSLPVPAVLASAIEDALAGESDRVAGGAGLVVRQMPLTPRSLAAIVRG